MYEWYHNFLLIKRYLASIRYLIIDYLIIDISLRIQDYDKKIKRMELGESLHNMTRKS